MVVYLMFALETAFYILFSSPSKSFAALHNPDTQGTWRSSYAGHQHFKKKIRYMAASGPLVIVTAVIATMTLLQIFVPTNVENAFAAGPTFQVTNTNDSGAGSLRQAIIDANGNLLGGDPIIDIVVSSEFPITLASPLPELTYNNVTLKLNNGGNDPIIVDGANLPAGSSCFKFGDSNDGSSISGFRFQNCPQGIYLNFYSKNITIGSGTGPTGRVYVTNSTYGTGIRVGELTSNIVLQNVEVVGSTNQQDCIEIAGSTNAIVASAVTGFCKNGLYIKDSTNTSVNGGYYGLRENNNSITNTDNGIWISGGSGTKILGINGKINASKNSKDGILISNNATGVTLGNVLTAGNGQNGITNNSVNSTLIGTRAPDPITAVMKTYTVESSGNSANGIRVTNSNTVTITDTYVGTDNTLSTSTGNGASGIFVDGSNGITIGETNKPVHIRKSINQGITLNSVSGAVVVDNTALQDNAEGINFGGDLSGLTSWIVKNSTFDSNGVTQQAIYVNKGANNGQFTNNNIISSKNDALVLDGVAPVTVSGNTFLKYDTAAVHIMATQGTAPSGIVAITNNNFGVSEVTTDGGNNGVNVDTNTVAVTIGGDSDGEKNIFRDNDIDINLSGSAQILENSFSLTDLAGLNYASFIKTADDAANLSSLIPDISKEALSGTTWGPGISGWKIYGYADGEWIGTTTADANGTWSIPSSSWDPSVSIDWNNTQFSVMAITNDTLDATKFTSPVQFSEDDTNDGGDGDGDNQIDINDYLSYVVDPATNEATVTVIIDQSIGGTANGVRIDYGTDANNLASNQSDESTASSYSFLLKNLTANTTYYYAFTLTANGGTYIGNTQQFTTDALSSTTGETISIGDINTTVNGTTISDARKNLNLERKTVQISVSDITSDRDLKLQIKNAKKQVIRETSWKEPNKNDVVNKKFKNLKRFVKYTAYAQVRKNQDKRVKSSITKIATFTKTFNKPAFTQLTGNVTVSSNLKDILLGGNIPKNAKGRIRLFNVTNGTEVVSCAFETDDDFCEMPFDPPAGTYTVLFDFEKNGYTSAENNSHLLQLSPAVMVDVFNTDKNHPKYNYRMTTADVVTTVGIGPKDSNVKLYIDGKYQGKAEWTSDVTWKYALPLVDCPAGSDCILEVRFMKKGKEVADRIQYPFKHANRVVDLLVAGGEENYLLNSTELVTVTGGANNIYRVKWNGELIVTSVLEATDNNLLGTDSFVLPTTSLGTNILEIQAEDPNTHLKGTAVKKTYTVTAPVTPIITTTPEDIIETEEDLLEEIIDTTPEETTEENDVTEETDRIDETDTNVDDEVTDTLIDPIDDLGEDTSETTIDDTETIVNDTIEETSGIRTIPELTLSDGVSVSTVDGVGIIKGEDIESIPEFYRTAVEDEQEKIVLQEKIEEKIVNETLFVPQSTTTDSTTGETIIVEPELTTDGVDILRNEREIGPYSREVNLEKAELVMKGTSEPFAIIYGIVRSDPVVKVTRADENGKWTLTVPLDKLPEGEHTAYVQSESRGVLSDEIEIANFVVIDDARLSSTSWVIIVNAFIVFTLLIITITIQIEKKVLSGNIGAKTQKTSVTPSSHAHLNTVLDDKKEKKTDPPDTKGPLDI